MRAMREQRTDAGDRKATPHAVPGVEHRKQSASAAVAKRLAESGEVRTICHTVQVTSFGGCGTTALYDHLSAAGADVPHTPGHFPFKHLRIPPDPESVPAGFRVVYLYGDPRNAVLSLVRRGHLEDAYLNLHLQPPPKAARQRLATLKAFLEAGIDDLQLEDHLERWLTREPFGYQVLFLRFESLTEAWPTVREFVGLSPGCPPLELTERNSDWRSLPQPQRTQIDRLYGGLARRIERLPPVQIL